MTFPIGNPQVQAWYNTLNNDVVNLQSACLLVQTQTNSGGTTPSPNVLNILTSAIQAKSDLTRAGSNSSLQSQLVAYYGTQLVWVGVNVITEFTTLFTLIGNLITAILADYPQVTPGSFLHDRTISAAGIVNVSLSAAQLPNTMSAITAYLAEVPVTPTITV